MSDNTEFVTRVRSLLREVTFGLYEAYVFKAGEVGGVVLLQASYLDRDIYTGKVEVQHTRKWLLSPSMTDSEIVLTAFKLAITSAEHRTREAFRYKGARIFGPHFDVEDLVRLCLDGREAAGGPTKER
jgi:hypothetical protein